MALMASYDRMKYKLTGSREGITIKGGIKMIKKAMFLATAVVFVLNLCVVEAASPPTTIGYQGYLTDSSGNAIDGATLDIQVEVFETLSGGGATYGETHANVSVTDGQFNVLLGDGTATTGSWPTNPDFSQALWLEITIDPSGANETLSPRIPLTTAPYARTALAVSDGVVTPLVLSGVSGNGTPGQVLSSDGGGGFAWANASASGGSGDITDVGDATGPTAFTGNDDGNSLIFEGTTTGDGNDTILTAADPGAAVTITLPATTGTVITSGDTGTVTSAMIAPDTIVAGDIDNDAVTLAKLAPGTAGNVITYKASGDPASVSTAPAVPVLTSNGAGAAPTFQAAGGGGGGYTTYTATGNGRVTAICSSGNVLMGGCISDWNAGGWMDGSIMESYPADPSGVITGTDSPDRWVCYFEDPSDGSTADGTAYVTCR